LTDTRTATTYSEVVQRSKDLRDVAMLLESVTPLADPGPKFGGRMGSAVPRGRAPSRLQGLCSSSRGQGLKLNVFFALSQPKELTYLPKSAFVAKQKTLNIWGHGPHCPLGPASEWQPYRCCWWCSAPVPTGLTGPPTVSDKNVLWYERQLSSALKLSMTYVWGPSTVYTPRPTQQFGRYWI